MNYKKIKVQFLKNGFVLVKNLINKKEIDEIFFDLNNIKKKVQKKNKQYYHLSPDGKFNSIHDINEFVKSGKIIDICKSAKLLRIVNSIFNEKCRLRNCEFFLKPKKTGMSAPFHQDNYYWNIENARALNVWIALSHVSKKNGGLCYLKESHNLGTINHEMSFMKGSSQKIPDKIKHHLCFIRLFNLVADVAVALIHKDLPWF